MGVTPELAITEGLNMKQELERIARACEARLDLLDRQLEMCRDVEDIELNKSQWWGCYRRYNATFRALKEISDIHHTNCGSADLRLETCRN